jgi:hypothetical protein
MKTAAKATLVDITVNADVRALREKLDETQERLAMQEAVNDSLVRLAEDLILLLRIDGSINARDRR